MYVSKYIPLRFESAFNSGANTFNLFPRSQINTCLIHTLFKADILIHRYIHLALLPFFQSSQHNGSRSAHLLRSNCYSYTHTYMHTYIHTHIHAYIHTYIHNTYHSEYDSMVNFGRVDVKEQVLNGVHVQLDGDIALVRVVNLLYVYTHLPYIHTYIHTDIIHDTYTHIRIHTVFIL